MEYYNEFTIEYDTKENALSQQEAVGHCLDEIDATQYGYSSAYNFGEVFRKRLTFDGEKKFTYGVDGEMDGFATPEDAMEVMPIMARNLAKLKRNASFELSSENQGTYTDSTVAIKYSNGKLVIDTIYYPSGAGWEMLSCPECGEDVVSMDDYEKGKVYTCPECGAECDFEYEYEEALPITNHIEEEIEG